MKTTPYKVHGFVCTNNRHGKRKSCADGDAELIRAELKAQLKQRGIWGSSARVSSSGCLGVCADGPNVMVYPQQKLFTQCTKDDVGMLVDEIVRLEQE